MLQDESTNGDLFEPVIRWTMTPILIQSTSAITLDAERQVLRNTNITIAGGRQRF